MPDSFSHLSLIFIVRWLKRLQTPKLLVKKSWFRVHSIFLKYLNAPYSWTAWNAPCHWGSWNRNSFVVIKKVHATSSLKWCMSFRMLWVNIIGFAKEFSIYADYLSPPSRRIELESYLYLQLRVPTRLLVWAWFSASAPNRNSCCLIQGVSWSIQERWECSHRDWFGCQRQPDSMANERHDWA